MALDSAANISLNVPLILNRSYSTHQEFQFYSGNSLRCTQDSSGISLGGAQSANFIGATINMQSANIFWHSACAITTDGNSADIIWLHTIGTGSSKIMRIGSNAKSENYSLTNEELKILQN